MQCSTQWVHKVVHWKTQTTTSQQHGTTQKSQLHGLFWHSKTWQFSCIWGTRDSFGDCDTNILARKDRWFERGALLNSLPWLLHTHSHLNDSATQLSHILNTLIISNLNKVKSLQSPPFRWTNKTNSSKSSNLCPALQYDLGDWEYRRTESVLFHDFYYALIDQGSFSG